MMIPVMTTEETLNEALRRAGHEAAAQWKPGVAHHSRRRWKVRLQHEMEEGLSAQRRSDAHQWLSENRRLIAAAIEDASEAAKEFGKRPHVIDPETKETLPRIYAIARAYLRSAEHEFSEETLVPFIAGVQEVHKLKIKELWNCKAALQFVLLEDMAEQLLGENADLSRPINSLRRVSQTDWKATFESMSSVDEVLRLDPAGAFASMDFESLEVYRYEIERLAKYSPATESEIAAAAITLAEGAPEGDSRMAVRRRHVGFYLIDAGAAALKAQIGYRPSALTWLREKVRQFPTSFYLIGVELATLLLVFSIVTALGSPSPIVAVLAFLILPATHAAVHFMSSLATLMVKAKILPRLDFSEGIPEDCPTAVAVPALLLNEDQVRNLVRDMEIRYLANPEPQLQFVLLSDSPDSVQEFDDRDALADLAGDLINELNQRHGNRFVLLHRHRAYNPAEGKWMGWERKRGKLIDFNRYLRGADERFPVTAGDVEALRRIRYVVTLDSDTQLPRGAAAKLVGTIAHPLNRAVIDPETKMVVEGYGILQPKISVSIHSSSRSWLANIYSGQTAFDIYTMAISDVYQDLFGEGIFTGKGIYEVDTFRAVLEKRFPNNTLLSHDLIEGAYARVGLMTDIELVDDFPSHFSAYCRRQHRWVRGDWQILRWLLPVVPDFSGKPILNPISLISAWKILDNLRRSLIQPATLLLLVAGWFWFSGSPILWTIATVGLLLIPAYSQLLFAIPRAPRTGIPGFLRETAQNFVKEHLAVFLQIVFLVHQSLLSLDAIVRSLIRTVKGQRLLEWETAAEAESANRKAPVDTYLEWTPWLAVAIAVLVGVFRPASLPAALPILLLWFLSRLISNWLNSPPRTKRDTLEPQEEQNLRIDALRTWRYFAEFSDAEENWLIPDNVREAGWQRARRISPTNLGLLLNARQAALEFGWITLEEFADQTRATLETALRMERYRGHFFNWYSTETLAALPPRFVSTVDSGNLAASLWSLKQACLRLVETPPSKDLLATGLRDFVEMIAELEPAASKHLVRASKRLAHESDAVDSGVLNSLREEAEKLSRDLRERTPDAAWAAQAIVQRIQQMTAESVKDTADTLRWIANTSSMLVSEMDFSFLYLRKRRVMSIGFETGEQRLERAGYDMLASEARTGAFVAIAKGDVPQESWFHMGRSHTLAHGRKVLLSWSGTMFEYLLPSVWMRHYPDTLLGRSCREVVAIHQKEGDRLGIPWGISECAYGRGGAECEYPYFAFGIPALALNPEATEPHVVAPYASFLALVVGPRAAYDNLQTMRQLGFRGPMGYFEAIDYSSERHDKRHPHSIVRAWMAHHQGMSLLAVCNLLRGQVIQNDFHAEPFVEATERILQERIPLTIKIISAGVLGQNMPQPVPEPAPAQ